jgi:hypothetical protein
MKPRSHLSVFLMATLLAGCATGQRVSYQHDVHPVLESNCFACHTPPQGAGYVKTGLNLQTYDTLMRGTLYGPVVMPGNSQQSILNMLVEGRADSSMRMPHNRERPLTNREIEILRLWVDQGANNN